MYIMDKYPQFISPLASECEHLIILDSFTCGYPIIRVGIAHIESRGIVNISLSLPIRCPYI